MTRRGPLQDEELTHQVRTHLVYELKWLIFAADAFQRAQGGTYVAFLDSAAVHARNLLEFATKRDPTRFTLHALGGTAGNSDAWDRWANNRVTHMLEREHHKAPWPDGRDAWKKPEKLMTMARAVLDRLREGGRTVPAGPLRDSYVRVMSAAEDYWREPTSQNHERLAHLYDSSQDEPYPE